MDGQHRRSLELFATIRTGDIVLMPAEAGKCAVHVGVVIRRGKEDRQVFCVRPGLPAYYYHHDVETGDRYENAHRVDVLWDRDGNGQWGIFHIDELAGVWRWAVKAGQSRREPGLHLAEELGLPQLQGNSSENAPRLKRNTLGRQLIEGS